MNTVCNDDQLYTGKITLNLYAKRQGIFFLWHLRSFGDFYDYESSTALFTLKEKKKQLYQMKICSNMVGNPVDKFYESASYNN